MKLGVLCPLCGYKNESETAFCTFPNCPLEDRKEEIPQKGESQELANRGRLQVEGTPSVDTPNFSKKK